MELDFQRHMFDIECAMYISVLPSLDPAGGVLAPRAFHADPAAGVIVMEDMRMQGWTMGDKKKG